MQKTIPVDKAVGMVLPHDVTCISKTKNFKGPAFRKGHIISEDDVPVLKDLGKENIYVLNLGPDDIHENEAAEILAKALAGQGVKVKGEPIEGKLSIVADCDGLLKINIDSLYQFNLLGEVMCSTLHNNTPVKQGTQVGATRLIPLVGDRSFVNRAAEIATTSGGIISVKELPKRKAGLVITGNEVFHGRIKDAFEAVLREKLGEIGSEVVEVRFAPDDVDVIATEIATCIKGGADLIITSGGM